MSMRIGGAGSAQWGSHVARIHLTTDYRRLSTDMVAGADQRVIASDKAAVVESRQYYAQLRGSNRFDVTV
ncbi:hypothetical protein [Paractinoplanes durhamensis]|uniref:Uncharacterized protein n=1 Tax=Paractinoplanes durhamensis TaxID=113563 RepID=A0ABQ3YQJ0_9ACTN|nr:hypothetical protein [Actinoplanes durhamensis]GID99831.1 hypothetical protein Adu01nite_11820 [Actinoplanes durhamensis]